MYKPKPYGQRNQAALRITRRLFAGKCITQFIGDGTKMHNTGYDAASPVGPIGPRCARCLPSPPTATRGHPFETPSLRQPDEPVGEGSQLPFMLRVQRQAQTRSPELEGSSAPSSSSPHTRLLPLLFFPLLPVQRPGSQSLRPFPWGHLSLASLSLGSAAQWFPHFMYLTDHNLKFGFNWCQCC